MGVGEGRTGSNDRNSDQMSTSRALFQFVRRREVGVSLPSRPTLGPSGARPEGRRSSVQRPITSVTRKNHDNLRTPSRRQKRGHPEQPLERRRHPRPRAGGPRLRPSRQPRTLGRQSQVAAGDHRSTTETSDPKYWCRPVQPEHPPPTNVNAHRHTQVARMTFRPCRSLLLLHSLLLLSRPIEPERDRRVVPSRNSSFRRGTGGS